MRASHAPSRLLTRVRIGIAQGLGVVGPLATAIHRTARIGMLALVCSIMASQAVRAQCSDGGATATLPPQFVDTVVAPGLDQAVGLEFDSTGRLFFWEKQGLVWTIENDVVSAGPLLDLREEVGNWSDHGLLGAALDPDFLANGYIYVLYIVDRHHLEHFGLPSYNPATNDYNRNTIGRLTRYTVDINDFASIVPGSRMILMGADPTTGIPICEASHGVGSLVFGSDGSLLVSTGNGGGDGIGGVFCIDDGIIRQAEDVSELRSQLLDTLSGKVLRIDPATGLGLPSNPFYDPLEPFAARSKVWSLGVRNPFRFSRRPGTGSTNPNDGDPGVFTLGDVGAGHWEELNVISSAGANLGFPIYEGMDLQQGGLFVDNLDAPNPLFGQVIAGQGLCSEAYFDFPDLLVQDSTQPPSWPNPCDPSQQIGAGAVPFVHQRPSLAWAHFQKGDPAVVPGYDMLGEALSIPVGDPGSPATGEQFLGNSSIGGAWYTGTSFPAAYHGTYFHADYVSGWIRSIDIDAAGNVTAVQEFAAAGGLLVGMAVDPIDGDLFYIDFKDNGLAAIHRISYEPLDVPPTAIAAISPHYGYGPLEVHFHGESSTDPEGGELTYVWDFGTDTPQSLVPGPTRVYPEEDITLDGTILAKVFELDPPHPTGAGNMDPEIIRDEDYAPKGSQNFSRQFDTTHVEVVMGFPNPLPVQKYNPKIDSLEDWIGYSFPAPRVMQGLVFQEGVQALTLGGFFDTMTVQLRDPGSGEWFDAEGLELNPLFPGSFNANGLPNVNFERFEIRFTPQLADGIRLYGKPGGLFGYFSVGELRVLAAPINPGTEPINYTVRLTVIDGASQSDCKEIDLSLNNTPPSVRIKPRGLPRFFSNSANTNIYLATETLDLEHAPFEVSCEWQLILHHNIHTHQETPLALCDTPAVLVPHAADPGDFLYYELRFTATDPLGLSSSLSRYVTPESDCNLNGFPDADDIAMGISSDFNGDGIPDECDQDCNGNEIYDLIEILQGDSLDENGNDVPDECEIFERNPSKELP